jgi:very-short-patch-repair endonuclease
MQSELAIVDVLRAFGGTARWSQLKGKVSRRRLARAVADGEVLGDHGTYSLPPTDYATRLARRLNGARSHRSAAEHWGFALPPCGDDDAEQHDIAVAPNAVRSNVPDDIKLRYLDLAEDDVTDGVLSPVATTAFCLRDLSLREALSVGDSALASGKVTLAQIEQRVARFRGPRRVLASQRLTLLNANSANAFESSCRALLIGAGIDGFESQVEIRHRGKWIGRVDFAHRLLRIVIECDGFETHGTLDAMTQDCIRHTRLVAAGWRPLRFTRYQGMKRPDWVLEQVRETLACTNQGSTERLTRRCACNQPRQPA